MQDIRELILKKLSPIFYSLWLKNKRTTTLRGYFYVPLNKQNIKTLKIDRLFRVLGYKKVPIKTAIFKYWCDIDRYAAGTPDGAILYLAIDFVWCNTDADYLNFLDCYFINSPRGIDKTVKQLYEVVKNGIESSDKYVKEIEVKWLDTKIGEYAVVKKIL